MAAISDTMATVSFEFFQCSPMIYFYIAGYLPCNGFVPCQVSQDEDHGEDQSDVILKESEARMMKAIRMRLLLL